jgi:hypothetical protein
MMESSWVQSTAVFSKDTGAWGADLMLGEGSQNCHARPLREPQMSDVVRGAVVPGLFTGFGRA